MSDTLNAASLPPKRFINFSNFINHKEIPRFPDHSELVTTLEAINRDESLLVFVSHSWLRGNKDAVGWNGKPHPDTLNNEKFLLCVDGIQQIKNQLAPAMKECYLWLDYCCINQDGKPALELGELDKIMQSCDVIFTPIVDEDPSWNYENFEDHFVSYGAKAWNGHPHAYLNRGWCRLEMFYAANIPVKDNSNGVVRHSLFKHALAFACQHNRRPHVLYGNHEVLHRETPHQLPPLQNSYFIQFSPSDGDVSKPEDKTQIAQLVQALDPYMKANEIKPGYEGDKDALGRPHGIGREVSEEGLVYEGQFVDGKPNGHGVAQYINGDIHEGNYVDGNFHGYGIIQYAIGAVYEGHFNKNVREGYGKMLYADGQVYEGDWLKDKWHGQGNVVYDDGNVYTGEFDQLMRHGYGVAQYADSGERYEGRYYRDRRQGWGKQTSLNGDTYEGRIF